MDNDKSPIYDPDEQGVSDDHHEWAPEYDERAARRERDRGARKDLISRLNSDDPLSEIVRGQRMATEAVAAAGTPGHIPRVVIYLRVSTEEQAKVGGEAEGYSIPSQRDACLLKVRAMGGIMVEEYIDAGESAKSARRPELQRMLRELKLRRIDFIVIHKIDRIARNRADDVEINAAIAKAGAKLVSVSEPVDDSPAGRLLYNMMADVAQYHSDNLGVEVLKGMNKKAELGGTPFRAPLGYLNVQEARDGDIIRYVTVDPVRGPLVRWMLKEYATGDWTVLQLVDALEVKGLKTRGGRKTAQKPVSAQTVHRLLVNPYFFGVVPYRGVFYEGKHEPLISADEWLRIQDVLRSHNYAGEKTRSHPHYLKSTIYCGECGSRLVYSRNKGNGGYYEYFICINRRTKRNPCSRTGVRLHKIEAGIARFYGSFRLNRAQVEGIQTAVRRELGAQRTAAAEDEARARRQLAKLKGEREKLLQAHYADAVPLDLMKLEMARITRETATAQQAISAAGKTLLELDDTLERALAVAEHCEREYTTAPPRVRRQINQGLFKKLYIDRDGEVERYDLTPPFAHLLEPSREAEDTQTAQDAPGITIQTDASNERVRPSDVWMRTFGTEDHVEAKEDRLTTIFDGLHMSHLVPPARFELATNWFEASYSNPLSYGGVTGVL